MLFMRKFYGVILAWIVLASVSRYACYTLRITNKKFYTEIVWWQFYFLYVESHSELYSLYQRERYTVSEVYFGSKTHK